MTRWKWIGELLAYLWPKNDTRLRLYVTLSMACLIIAKVLTAAVPQAYKAIVDRLGETPAGSVLLVPLAMLLAYGGARLSALLFQELRDVLFVRVSQRAARKVSLRVFHQLHALSLRFHLSRQTGALARIMERGTRAVETVLSRVLFSFAPILFEIALVSIILWRMFDIWFMVATLATVVVYIAYTIVMVGWRLRFRREMNEINNEASTRAVDSLLNYETVKYFGNEQHEAGRLDESLDRYEGAAVRNQSSFSVLNLGQAAIITTGLVGVMTLAAQGVAAGRMTLGDFVLVNAYLLQLFQPLGFFGMMYRDIKQALVDMEQLFTLLDVNPEIKDAPGAQDLAVPQGAVDVEDVHFAYDARRPILTGVSFRIAAGHTVAVVGATGAGKSTLSRLMFRFYDVTAGAIRIDGQDIAAVTQSSLRRAIGIVPQDTVLFNDTVRYNIAYGKPGATDADCERAARMAHVHDFIVSLPDGYDTKVGERGLKLSGGEKQRVAIARAILKDPPILVFDEATSALDTHTERTIQANLREVSRGRTTLVIAHRLSTVIDADEILVLDAGRIAERGKHDDLLARNGLYAALWRHQSDAGEGSEVRDETSSA